MDSEAETVMQLRNELRDKEMKLTDIRLEALSSAHQLDQLREAMNRMQVSTQEHGRSPRLPGKDWQVAAPRHTPRPLRTWWQPSALLVSFSLQSVPPTYCSKIISQKYQSNPTPPCVRLPAALLLPPA